MQNILHSADMDCIGRKSTEKCFQLARRTNAKKTQEIQLWIIWVALDNKEKENSLVGATSSTSVRQLVSDYS